MRSPTASVVARICLSMIRGSGSMGSALAIPWHVLIGDLGMRGVNGIECAHLTRKDIPGTDGDAGLAALGCNRWEKPRTIGKQVRATTSGLRTLTCRPDSGPSAHKC